MHPPETPDSAPLLLQRMLPRLQPYHLTIRYQPGRSMEIADVLSRLSPEEKQAIPGLNVQVHEVDPQFSSNMLHIIKSQTSSDPELSELKEMVHSGWPPQPFSKLTPPEAILAFSE